MPKKPVQRGSKDPLLAKLEKAVTDILDNEKASVRAKQTAVQLGIKLAQIKHQIVGDDDDGKGFFG
jgi:hypothetical protein